MPIKIPDSLPATATLESENIFVMTEYRAMHQDIRPLKLLILNLMPTKIVTETVEDLGTLDLSDIDWVIVGGESGNRARKVEKDWI